MADKQDSKFNTGLIIGAILGGLGAFFLSPKAGKENRKLLAKKVKELQDSFDDLNIQDKVEQIFGDVSEESMKMYKTAKKDLAKRLEDVKDTIEDFDQDKYVDMVETVMDDVKNQVKGSSKHVEKLKAYLLDNWEKITMMENNGEEVATKKAKKKS